MSCGVLGRCLSCWLLVVVSVVVVVVILLWWLLSVLGVSVRAHCKHWLLTCWCMCVCVHGHGFHDLYDKVYIVVVLRSAL